MSRCHFVGTELCHHSCVKIYCMQCTIENLEIKCIGLQTRVEALHEFKLNQIDANTKKEKKQREEKVTLNMFINEVCSKLEKLEQSREAGSRTHKDIFDRLEKLEQHIEKIVSKSNISNEKRPFKCVVCFGTTIIELESLEEYQKYKNKIKNHDNGKPYIQCKSCDGKGIVWG